MTSRRALGVALLLIAPHLFAGSQAEATHAALSTASPYATSIGLDVLKSGGNAADAAVAAAFALGVAQPQSSGIGGGGFLIYYDAATRGVWTLDFRELAPAGAPPGTGRTGAAAAGVPGAVAGLEALHKRFGSKPWRDLVTPAARLAAAGFAVDLDLATALLQAHAERHLDLFLRDGKPPAVGETLVQGDLAATLQRIAEKGADGFYDGDTAKQLVESVRAAGGTIGLRDLRAYKPVWRAPIKIAFGGVDIYCVPPPSSGGMVIASILKIASGLGLDTAQSAKTLHLLAEAERRAFIDRDKYAADPTAGRVPLRDLLGDERARLWRAGIDAARATPTLAVSEPVANPAEATHTTHISIIDAAGNMAAVTTSLGGDFGSGFMTGGFFLNAALNDFTSGGGSANAFEPGKRPVASMAPTLVLRGGKPLLALGSAGGTAIPATVVEVLLNAILFHMPIADAVAAPRYNQQAHPDELEYEMLRAPEKTVEALRAMGHSAVPRQVIGDVHAVAFENGKIVAVADPRHGGAAGGF